MGQKPAIDLSSSMGWAEKAHLCASPKATFSCRDGSGDLGSCFLCTHADMVNRLLLPLFPFPFPYLSSFFFTPLLFDTLLFLI